MKQALPVERNRSLVRLVWWIVKSLIRPFNRICYNFQVINRHFLDVQGDEPVVYAIVNHESYLDWTLFADALHAFRGRFPTSFLAFTTLYHLGAGWLGYVLAALGCVPVRHHSDPTAVSPRILFERVRAGWPLAVFLDGGWNERASATDLANSASYFAIRHGATIVPVIVWFESIHEPTRFPRFWQLLTRLRRLDAKLIALAPRSYDHSYTTQQVTARLREEFRAAAREHGIVLAWGSETGA